MVRRWIITIGLLFLGIAGIFGYKQSLMAAQQEQSANVPEPAAVVEAVEAQQDTYQQLIKVNGTVQAYKQLQLSNELPGKIKVLNLGSGSEVQKGQLLVELDHSEESARLQGAKASLILNQQTLKRVRELQKSNKISDEEVDRAAANVSVAKADIAALEATIAKKKLYAPFNARVGIHNLEAGQYLQANSQITDLIGIQPYTWIDFNMPQTYRELALGTEVEVRAISLGAQTATAQVIAVDPSLSSSSRNLKYRAQVSADKLALRPHTLVKVTVPVASDELTVSVPDLAVTRDHLGDYVFLLEEEGEGAYRAKRQKVILGARQGDRVMIKSGLEVGQLIAAKGAFKLRPGLKVFISQPQA